MEPFNAKVAFKDFVDCLNASMKKVLSGSSVMGTVIVEEECREFEQKHPVGTLFSKGIRPPGVQVTRVQRDQLLSIFGDAASNFDKLDVL